MDSRIICITSAAQKHGNLNINACGKDFFPQDIYGSSSRKGYQGVPIKIKIAGLNSIVETDIPVDRKTKRPRGFFRERAWAKEFVEVNGLVQGDKIIIRRLSERTYEVLPEIIQNNFSEEVNKNCSGINLVEPTKNRKNLQEQLFESKSTPFPSPKKYSFTFIDLFAGIGGFRIAMQNLGGKCVFSSEWDKDAQRTYRANFGEVPFGDITKEETKKHIPNGFDVLCAGFPCQAFSIAGRRGGFNDTRGTLFFDVAEIIKRKKPKAIFLENVKGLRSHDKGKTLETILSVLRNDLNYFVPEPQIINAKDFGVPQSRERIYIVGFRKDHKITNFEYPKPIGKKVFFAQVKEKKTVGTRYYLSTQYLQTLRNHKARHASKGNGFGFEIIQDNQIANAIVVGGMGKERNLVIDNRIKDFTPETKIKGVVNREGIRKMTPREWARLQGFPDKYIIPVADASAYKQFGNSVAVPAIQNTANKILEAIGIKNHANGK